MKRKNTLLMACVALCRLAVLPSNAACTSAPASQQEAYVYRPVPERLVAYLREIVASPEAAGAIPAGDTLTIIGKVLDKQTGRPIPYASVGIQGRALGTITNEEGMFDFYVPAGSRNDIVLVSCIGYAVFKAKAGELAATNAEIRLEPATYQLGEAVMKAKKGLSAEQIVRKARQKITGNYPTKPYRLEAYYRKYQKVDGRYVYFTDAALEVYDGGYQRGPGPEVSRQEQVVLRQTRQSHYQNPKPYENALDREKRYHNSIHFCLIQNAVRYWNEVLRTGHYTYRLDSVIRQDTSTFYLITARSSTGSTCTGTSRTTPASPPISSTFIPAPLAFIRSFTPPNP
jgi:hypothetical protein